MFKIYFNKPNSNNFSLLPFVNYWWFTNNYILAIGWGKWSFSINFDKTILEYKFDSYNDYRSRNK